MRLNFQIMWFIILSSVTQIEFASGYSSRRDLHRAAHQARFKRLLNHNSKFVDDRGSFQGTGERDHSGCDNDGDKPSPQPRPRKLNSKSHGTGIAMKAAIEAKQANDDMESAVKEASDRIKLEFSEKAAAAARAAEAVLSGKLQVLEQLEMEVREAEIIVQEESSELSSAESNSQLALKAHRQAQEELKLLITGQKLARENCDSAEQVSAACQQSMADKTSLLEAAQKRVSVLLRQLSEARNDYAKTQKAARNALCAANEARQRINHVKP
ncbi:uncharacterized protein LOC6573400 [Drosophila mojavensis]|uniref:Uncharacterized protein n=1 Tax=Drosophila mojavensis TaxID=7230 RepID=B4KDU5_DROMO|nr:uncharacterized protein LOC6573400 [Drosophila mojavensis]EDW14942.1 uncharacterized protein Dmoj_GI23042 [Drosophila mojavensis]